ncbi:hypothetical protein F66182_10921 [Fusarium sp. NRRL 66182]|nr:hypothetical protein F66182_10921 [Fusarium sp. NRRL 66182]
MQLQRLLLLALLFGAEASKIVARQDTDSVATTAAAPTTDEPVPTTADDDDDDDDTTTAAEPTTAADPTTAAEPTTAEETTAEEPTEETTSAGDVTVTRTTTVTDSDARTVSRQTTVLRTITSTVVVTSTAFETETVTSDAETATETEYVTSTRWANERRAVDLAPRTVGGEEFMAPIARRAPEITTIPADFVPERYGEEYGLRAFRRGLLHKRATVTEFVTVTEGDDTDTTIFNTISRTVISTVSRETEITSTITETEAAGASTTVTVTSTLVVTSTRVTTGVVRTATVAPSGEYGPAGTGGADSDDSDGSSGSSSGGLSTGAKAGIGAGAGVAGLVILGGLLWFCLKRRSNKQKNAEYDDVFGASEVPVGGGGGAAGTSPHMAQVSPVTAASNLTPARNTTTSSNEGYRGTALGDGRAGFAKPQQFGRSYMNVSPETNYSRPSDQALSAVSPATGYTELASDSAATKWHQTNAAEIDGNQVSSARGTAPPENVYEMPAQTYR